MAAHAHGTGGIKAAIRAGVRTIDHGTMLDDEAIELLKNSPGRTYLVPTLSVSEFIQKSAWVPDSESSRAHVLTVEAIKATLSVRGG